MSSSDSNSKTSNENSFMQSGLRRDVFTIALINARSLKPKLDSLKITLNELCADVCLITETWFQNTPVINSAVQDFTQKTDYEILRHDRKTGRRGGGVAVCFNRHKINFTKAKIPPTKHEVYAAVGRRTGQRRKVVVLVVYVPPYYNADQNRSLMSYTNDALLAIKAKYDDPAILMGGDFNRRDFRLATSEHQDMKQVSLGATRGTAALDIIATNINESIIDNGTTEAIWNECGTRTDHLTAYASFRMPRVPTYKIEKYSYRHLSEEAHLKFGKWLETIDWQPVLGTDSANEATAALHSIFEQGLETAYEYKTRKKKTSEPEWMTDWLRQDIEDRRKVFKTDQKRSPRWKILKKKTAAAVKKRKKKLNDNILSKFENETNPGKFFHHLHCLMGKNSGPRWSPTQMFPGEDAMTVSNKLAVFFNDISSQYQPLKEGQIPTTFNRQLPRLMVAEVSLRMKKSKKPSSTVPGDIPALLYNKFHDELAVPVTHIFNLITETAVWPAAWKMEYITVIPKSPSPTSPGECRNIACTNYLSKLYESILLEWSREEVRPKPNQFGG